jgi:hypothetical protein
MADSCVGSKSSINGGGAKNVLGTFTPPRRIILGAGVLRTLDEKDVRSGVGEMLKVHAIAGPAAFDAIAADYPRLFTDRSVMTAYLRRSLEIKKPIVEADEFDQGRRLVMNYGHSFGHALESATAFAVPHGIAVTIGMDMAQLHLRLSTGGWRETGGPRRAGPSRGFPRRAGQDRRPAALGLISGQVGAIRSRVTADERAAAVAEHPAAAPGSRETPSPSCRVVLNTRSCAPVAPASEGEVQRRRRLVEGRGARRLPVGLREGRARPGGRRRRPARTPPRP